MSSIFVDLFDPQALWSSKAISCLTLFFYVLAILISITAFAVTVTLTVVSVARLYSRLLPSRAGEMGDGDLESGSARLQVVEALNRIIQERGRLAAAAEEARLRAAVARLPPLERHRGDIGLKDCVICLDEFQEDEMCQGFPACQHVFHSYCIVSWLKSHSTCPLCRTCIFYQQRISPK